MSERDLFIAALQIEDAAARAAYLDAACAGDAALRQRLEVLLQAHAADSFLEPPPAAASTTDAFRPTAEGPPSAPAAAGESSGMRLGPYRLLQQIGTGGMGVVWMAEQQTPLRRLVALKVIKAGMDSAQVIARFEQERQALALMDHPNIARVLDGGTTDSGRPFFVMELVKGTPITKYCDEHRLTPRERLALFVPVCQAVQHAHQKGIIHRDLKPSNVLVAPYDGRPVVKVIDFGVAKATGPRLTDRTLFTEFGAVIGTLEYMSPEQAELNNQDIDTRSDIYALGVLLYELLTGSTPLERSRLRQAAFAEVLRCIREEEPPRPSQRLSASKDALPVISAQRQTEPARLTKLMRGELDWIVMKALDKDRGRRYETANGLAQDVERYLQDEPVAACPPSAGYWLRKFLRRNRRPVLVAAALLLALLGGIVGTTWGLVRALEAEADTRMALAEVAGERDRAAGAERRVLTSAGLAESRRKEAVKQSGLAEERRREAEKQTGVARQEKKRAEAVRDYLLAVFHRANPEVDGRRVTVVEVLTLGVERTAVELRDQPLVQADMFAAIGASFTGLGLFKEAAEALERAERILLEHHGKNHPDTLDARVLLANAYLEAGQAAKSVRLNEELLPTARTLRGADHAQVATILNNLGHGYQELGRYLEAVEQFEEALKLNRAQFGPDDYHVLYMVDNLARAYQFANRLGDAVPMFEDVLRRRRALLGDDHPETLRSINSLGYAYLRGGRAAAALPLFEEAVAGRKEKLGPTHPKTLRSMDNLAQSYLQLKRLKEAIPLFEETLEKRTARLSANHPDTLVTKMNLAATYKAAGRIGEAIKLYEQLREQEEATLGPDHPYAQLTLRNLAQALHEAKEFNRAAQVWRALLAAQGRKLPADHPVRVGTQAVLGLCLLQAGKPADAEPVLRPA